MDALRERGIAERALPEFADLEPETILDTCRWYDEQRGRVGEGVLVHELRAGGRKPRQRTASVSDDYLARLEAWLADHFPDLVDDNGRPHYAAMVAALRLHGAVRSAFRRGLGDGQLHKTEHGPTIRQAVQTWIERYGDPVPTRTEAP